MKQLRTLLGLLLTLCLAFSLASCSKTPAAGNSDGDQADDAPQPVEAETQPAEENGYIDGLSFRELDRVFQEKYPDLSRYTIYPKVRYYLDDMHLEVNIRGDDQVSSLMLVSDSGDEEPFELFFNLMELHDKDVATSFYEDNTIASSMPFDEWVVENMDTDFCGEVQDMLISYGRSESGSLRMDASATDYLPVEAGTGSIETYAELSDFHNLSWDADEDSASYEIDGQTLTITVKPWSFRSPEEAAEPAQWAAQYVYEEMVNGGIADPKVVIHLVSYWDDSELVTASFPEE